MPFNTALSGIRAANSDLKITGNNIANASTTGFKSSRAEFGDVYATTILGSGVNTIGGGVRLQAVSQQFSQGNISFTENELDLAISGAGFFIVDQGGDRLYTRAGTFGLDKDGYIVTNSNARLQGFGADINGIVGGVLGDMQIQTGNQAPRQTTLVDSALNLDANAPVLQRSGSTLLTDGNAIAVTQAGLQVPTTSTVDSANFALPGAGFDFNANTITFDLQLAGAGSGNNGTVSITLNTASGVPANINNFNDLRTLEGVINGQIFSPTLPQTPIDVLAVAVDDGGGNFHLEFQALQGGEAAQVTATNASANAGTLGLAGAIGAGTIQDNSGTPAVNNGYPQQGIDIVGPDQTVTYTSAAGATASEIASEMNALAGVTATATTTARLVNAGYSNAAGNMIINLNNVPLTSNDLTSLAAEINGLSNSTLPGVTAQLDATTGDLIITSNIGDDLSFTITSTTDGDTLEVLGNAAVPSQTLEADPSNNGVAVGNTSATANGVVVGGEIDLILDEGYTLNNPNPPAIGLYSPFTSTSFTPFVINQFDPTDQTTYNHTTSVNVYDSLGNSHIMTQYFVRQAYDPNDPATSPNHWLMYVQVDGVDVGDPDTTLPPPGNVLPTEASFNLRFNSNGALDTASSDQILISNWTPLDDNGNPNGALGPQNRLQGGALPVVEPPTSSNMEVSMDGTSQYGSSFAVNNVDQNGYTTGRLSGIDLDDEGVLFARFTNGEAQVLGQLAIADFANVQGLQPAGDTMWAENFESGIPQIGTPGTAALGIINSGALEDSNVDLSEQLVNLIIAQRNFQASAKTIETADAVTQTIINLR
ncbi:flagellar hook-basal body complex protein [Simiduia curdlanivorans]|uniref:Flagellar hook protein FlgE n=1 Tax=Simiduia curdlanivorans TaxID=1492769 RepID=A0ABV8V1J6_9GAMM|nr:flagellar hook-basal body complex protein [Simiduia curdlanivorans]MDN3639960.1 flagellar hook-basal body complex protein [Simiduia curdlanivorans]